ncbi:aminotransferase class V-fold PLP-dependent enzyme [uncultured Dubosiella sp.]|uniref:aminotransferase class V-fold PLP-dependent enzyme n=1 Tax=uncultured Dubosiella sp. TaxID=1937011 RepID=UPI0025924319|nr:aminotransferase class V-fold PLP-dependent enzyme [uncultured Dubosiella sp.]
MDIKDKIYEIREDFPILKRKMCDHPLVYLDNSATTLKPKSMIDTVVNYYTYLGANAHRGDYEMSAQVDFAYENARKLTKEFIHARRDEEIVFTSGTTESLNILAMTITNTWLHENDVVLSTVAEHASSVLPWLEAGKSKNIKVEYIPLDEQGRVTVDNFKKALHDKVKVVALAQVSNVLGYEAPIKDIVRIAHERGVKVVVDGAQSIAHLPVDVQDLDVDFFCFSAHKMCGPTGIGVLYGKFDLLEELTPVFFGGESNARFNKCGKVSLKKTPLKYESGTQPIEGALGMAAAMKYINELGKENIHRYELALKHHFLEKIKEVEKVKVYNAEAESGIITFNVYDQGKLIFPQDVASFLNTRGIAVRSGEHCAKLLGEVLKVPGTCRASVYFYNTFEDIDKLVEALKDASFETCLDIFF